MKHFREIRSARKTSQESGDGWRYQFSPDHSYEETFKYLLGSEKLKDIVDKWPDCSQIAALDLMGYGAVFNNLGLEHAVGLALSDQRPEEMKEKQGDAVSIVEGDILSPQTWKKLDNWLASRDLEDPLLKLVLFRPIGGMMRFPNHPDIVYRLLNEVWKRMSTDNAEFIGVIPHKLGMLPDSWIEEVTYTPGITIDAQTHTTISRANNGMSIVTHQSPSPAIRLIKHPNAPEELPTIAFREVPIRGSKHKLYYPDK